ncbi:NAD-dependent epimerase/dehydratase family protein [candidate division WOR-3 bacterium]|nr:NAD-dependent epimerase/dehydratase family protein [candidate division WOR-3 bacterium]
MNQHDPSARSRILVTGGTGFIGKHLVAALVPHVHVRALVRRTSDITFLQKHKDIEIVYGNLDTEQGLDQALYGMESVVHCAARTIGTTYDEYYRTNTLGTLRLVKAMQRNKVTNILLLSTNAASGPSASQQPVCETDEPRPVSHYGTTKKLAEDIIQQSGLHFTILRPVAVYGPYDMDMLKYITLIAQGICPVVGFGEKYLNMIYVNDLVHLMVACVVRQAYLDRTFFVHDGHCYRFSDAVHTIARILGRKVRIVHIPTWCAIAYSLLNEVLLPPAKRLIRRDKIYELACRYWLCSTEHLKKEFGFEPRYTLAQGMEETIKWYRRHNFLP